MNSIYEEIEKNKKINEEINVFLEDIAENVGNVKKNAKNLRKKEKEAKEIRKIEEKEVF